MESIENINTQLISIDEICDLSNNLFSKIGEIHGHIDNFKKFLSESRKKFNQLKESSQN